LHLTVLFDAGSSKSVPAANGMMSQEWDMLSVGNGNFSVVNRASGLALAIFKSIEAA
jgi:hypothetical protein